MSSGWEIVAAVGQATGALATAAAVWVAVRTLRLQQDDRRREQAGLITLWVEGRKQADQAVLHISNGSALPAHVRWDADGGERVRLLTAGQETTPLVPWKPGSDYSIKIRDVHGNEWRRTAAGELSLLTRAGS
jgi:hypothetical protein